MERLFWGETAFLVRRLHDQKWRRNHGQRQLIDGCRRGAVIAQRCDNIITMIESWVDVVVMKEVWGGSRALCGRQQTASSGSDLASLLLGEESHSLSWVPNVSRDTKMTNAVAG